MPAASNKEVVLEENDWYMCHCGRYTQTHNDKELTIECRNCGVTRMYIRVLTSTVPWKEKMTTRYHQVGKEEKNERGTEGKAVHHTVRLAGYKDPIG